MNNRYDVSEQELSHYGIKGQKWGVRRFQNADGSLTADGKERYRRGENYSKELDSLEEKYESRLQSSSPEYKKLKKEADYIDNKYLIKNNPQYTEDELRDDEARRVELWEEMDKYERDFYKKSMKEARKTIREKYGNDALYDIDHYNKVNQRAITATFLGAMVAVPLSLFFGGKMIKKGAKFLFKTALNKVFHS